MLLPAGSKLSQAVRAAIMTRHSQEYFATTR
jgi:hypothetical protein